MYWLPDREMPFSGVTLSRTGPLGYAFIAWYSFLLFHYSDLCLYYENWLEI